VEIIKILLDKAMCVDLKNAKDSSPLHLSALNGNLETTNALVRRDAPLNISNEFCATSLMLADSNGN
jgi:ankyrin repeat protein